MAENKTTTPKDNIKLLQTYKSEKFASLMQQISHEKNRALVLKSAIKAKIVQINEIEFEREIAAEKANAKVEAPVVEDESGCKSAIGATIVVMTATLALGATTLLKKKED